MKDPTGKVVFAFGGEVGDRSFVTKSCVLEGKCGDKYTVSITDNLSSYWEVYTSDRTPVRVHLVPASQFSNGVSLFFGVRVPAGVKSFTLEYTGCHLGSYGIVLIGPDGKVRSVKSKINTALRLPWVNTPGDTGSSRCDVTVERKDSSKEELYRFFTWSGGDVLLDLKGVPPVLEFVR